MAIETEPGILDPGLARRAAERFRATGASREAKRQAVKAGRFTDADTQVRLAKRLNRLVARASARMPGHPENLPRMTRDIVARGRPIEPGEVNDRFYEVVHGETVDFLSVSFLSDGLQAARPVGRVVVPRAAGRRGWSGTGFLVAPGVMMTNHHVLPTAAVAGSTRIELDYEVDTLGAERQRQVVALRPDLLFLADRERDFALVATDPRSEAGRETAEWGVLPLVADEGKLGPKDFVNIVQHPRGRPKEVVVRENALLDLPDDPGWIAHYRADTEPGSSGAPVFNDQWEVVALHHSGVPRMLDATRIASRRGGEWQDGDDPADIEWVANEGIRVSRLVARIKELQATAEGSAAPTLLAGMLAAGAAASVPATPRPVPVRTPEARPDATRPGDVPMTGPQATGSATLTIPLTITVTVAVSGAAAQATLLPTPTPTPTPSSTADRALALLTGAAERVEIDPDYDSRPGYDPDFLGFPAPLPTLSPAQLQAAARIGEGWEHAGDHVLRYQNYSVIMNAPRRIAFVAAVNIDAQAPAKHAREQGADDWSTDPRILDEEQTGEDLYDRNALDRGHLVRRDDAAWGADAEEAKLRSDDTFHFTNCSPQYDAFNQTRLSKPLGGKLWGDLEVFVSRQAARNGRLAVFNGPVFQTNDRRYRGVQLPRRFWKLIAWTDSAGTPRATAFLLSQASLLQGLKELAEERQAAFDPGEFRTAQTAIAAIERLTGLGFAALRVHDVLAPARPGAEAAAVAPALDTLDDIVLTPAG